jgi:hypothetical protein
MYGNSNAQVGWAETPEDGYKINLALCKRLHTFSRMCIHCPIELSSRRGDRGERQFKVNSISHLWATWGNDDAGCWPTNCNTTPPE